ncbi:hypothetical protein VPNG_04367 [Cytospora leucostoma]|uniref:Uncharacterized protein n=1 Tax=Cytospora leucostoma TaxID=1230097 RepID=A0A423XBU9_9PEZI|nr:hypothetical protein VPNG_04367 [Cytospora leucostoma]
MPSTKTSSSGGGGTSFGSGQPSGGGWSSSTVPKVGPQNIANSGGFNKYPCKNRYTHNCTEWVYVKNATCTPCLCVLNDLY